MTTVITIVLQEAGMAVPLARTQPPIVRVSSRDALVYTMRELNQQTARIMGQIEKTGKPAFITRHGRFIALIQPLAPGQVESRVLTAMAREIGKQVQSRAAITQ
jgi:antitoxin (DNA-binding transcriptional repressor) of toxin-antitoxin stability system